MPSVDYHEIEHLIDDVSERGRRLRVTFRCPRSGRRERARVRLNSSASRSGSRSGHNSGRRSRSRSGGVAGFVMSLLFGWLLRRFGWRGFGRRTAARRLTRGVLSGGSGGSSLGGDTERQRLIMEAFREVQDDFVWDETSKEWVHRRAR